MGTLHVGVKGFKRAQHSQQKCKFPHYVTAKIINILDDISKSHFARKVNCFNVLQYCKHGQLLLNMLKLGKKQYVYKSLLAHIRYVAPNKLYTTSYKNVEKNYVIPRANTANYCLRSYLCLSKAFRHKQLFWPNQTMHLWLGFIVFGRF